MHGRSAAAGVVQEVRVKDFADARILLWTTVPNHATEDANHCIETYALETHILRGYPTLKHVK